MVSRAQSKLLQLLRVLPHANDLEILDHTFSQIDFAIDSPELIFEKLTQTTRSQGIKQVKLLVNNVGIGGYGSFNDATYEDLIKLLKVNFSSHVIMTSFFKEKIERSTTKEHTGIIFVNSLLGCKPIRAFRFYPYAKVSKIFFLLIFKELSFSVYWIHDKNSSV